MLNISNQSDYGILFISYLLDKNDFVPLSELVKNTKLPQRFLARIAAELAKHKIVESKEGRMGGFKLTNKAKTISLYDYLKIFEGELSFVKCANDSYCCQWEKICCQRNFLRKTLDKVIIKELKRWKLLDAVKVR